MTRPLDEADRQKILEFYQKGYTFAEISSETGHSKSTISKIVNDAKKADPLLDDVRKLTIFLKQKKISLIESYRGANLFGRLDELGVKLADLPTCIQAVEKHGPNTQIYLESAAHLAELERRTGKDYGKLIAGYEEKSRSLKQLESKLQEAKSEYSQIEHSIVSINELKLIQQKLEDNNITPRILDEFIERHKSLEENGFNLDVATALASALSKLGLTPQQSVSLLIEILEKYPHLRDCISKMTERKDTLTGERHHLKSEIETLGNQKDERKHIIQNLNESIKRLELKHEELDKEYERKVASINMEHKNLMEKLNQKYSDRVSELNADISSRESRKLTLEQNIDKLERYIPDIQKQLEMFDSKIKEKGPVASMVLLLVEPQKAGEPQLIVTMMLCLMNGLKSYIEANSKSLRYGRIMLKPAKELIKVFHDELVQKS